ncbi:MAG: hypothetical protein IJG42_07830 [Muribaculaceae bacterium]|nr:hypothetical protein [Muribaculaceae bacterium]
MCDEINNGYDIEGGELTCDAPKISWDWNPGDVGQYGDGILTITAKGDGFVMIEADERIRTGEDEAVMIIKAEYGQTIIAEAYIARAGTPVSPTTRITIQVPDRDEVNDPEPTSQAPKISWEWEPEDVGEFGDGMLVITATGNGFVRLDAANRTRTGEDEAVLRIKAKYGQTIIAEAYIAKDGTPVSPITRETIEIPDEDKEPEPIGQAPRISWEWEPGDVGEFGDGHLVIRATGNGFVRLDADGRTRTGDGEAVLNIKAEYGQTIIAEAYLAKDGIPASPITKETIVVPGKDDKPRHIPRNNGHNNAPVLVFGDANGKQINEISLAPGEKQTVKIILQEHPKPLTKGIQVQWTMFDSSHNPTDAITCVERPRTNEWITPLNLSSTNESQGGLEGNVSSSNRNQSTNWRWIGYNNRINQFWYPRDQFTPPIAVAEFTIQAPSDWKDKFATLELDREWSMFVESDVTTIGDTSQYKEYCEYDMKLTIRNKNAITGGVEIDPNNSKKSKCPVLAFGDKNGNVIKEVTLSPGEEKKIKLMLIKHPEAVTMATGVFLNMLSSRKTPTHDIACVNAQGKLSKDWITPLNLSTSNPDVGGIKGNQLASNYIEKLGEWNFLISNSEKNQVWIPRNSFVPPIAVAEFTIKASMRWTDRYSIFKLNTKKTEFVVTPETTPFSLVGTSLRCNYDLELVIKNKGKIGISRQIQTPKK